MGCLFFYLPPAKAMRRRFAGSGLFCLFPIGCADHGTQLGWLKAVLVALATRPLILSVIVFGHCQLNCVSSIGKLGFLAGCAQCALHPNCLRQVDEPYGL